MSTPVRSNMLRIHSAPCAKRFAVPKERETLAEYVRRIRDEKQLSLRDVSVRSGGKIANSHISRIESGEARGVSVEKLRALAKGLGVSEEEIFAVARGKPLDDTEIVDAEMALYASRVKKLTPQQRRDFQVAWKMAKDLIDRMERENSERQGNEAGGQ